MKIFLLNCFIQRRILLLGLIFCAITSVCNSQFNNGFQRSRWNQGQRSRSNTFFPQMSRSRFGNQRIVPTRTQLPALREAIVPSVQRTRISPRGNSQAQRTMNSLSADRLSTPRLRSPALARLSRNGNVNGNVPRNADVISALRRESALRNELRAQSGLSGNSGFPSSRSDGAINTRGLPQSGGFLDTRQSPRSDIRSQSGADRLVLNGRMASLAGRDSRRPQSQREFVLVPFRTSDGATSGSISRSRSGDVGRSLSSHGNQRVASSSNKQAIPVVRSSSTSSVQQSFVRAPIAKGPLVRPPNVVTKPRVSVPVVAQKPMVPSPSSNHPPAAMQQPGSVSSSGAGAIRKPIPHSLAGFGQQQAPPSVLVNRPAPSVVVNQPMVETRTPSPAASSANAIPQHSQGQGQASTVTQTNTASSQAVTNDVLYEELVSAFTEALQKTPPAAGQPQQPSLAKNPLITAPQAPAILTNAHLPQPIITHVRSPAFAPFPVQPPMVVGPFGYASPWFSDPALHHELIYGDTTDPPEPLVTTTISPSTAQPVMSETTVVATSTPVKTPPVVPLKNKSKAKVAKSKVTGIATTTGTEVSTAVSFSEPTSTIAIEPVSMTREQTATLGQETSTVPLTAQVKATVAVQDITVQPKLTTLAVDISRLANNAKTKSVNRNSGVDPTVAVANSIATTTSNAQSNLLPPGTDQKMLKDIIAMLSNTKPDMKTVEAAIHKVVNVMGKLPPELEAIASQLGFSANATAANNTANPTTTTSTLLPLLTVSDPHPTKAMETHFAKDLPTTFGLTNPNQPNSQTAVNITNTAIPGDVKTTNNANRQGTDVTSSHLPQGSDKQILAEITNMLSVSNPDMQTVGKAIKKAIKVLGNFPPDLAAIASKLGFKDISTKSPGAHVSIESATHSIVPAVTMPSTNEGPSNANEKRISETIAVSPSIDKTNGDQNISEIASNTNNNSLRHADSNATVHDQTGAVNVVATTAPPPKSPIPPGANKQVLADIIAMLSIPKPDLQTVELAFKKAVSVIGHLPPDLQAIATQLGFTNLNTKTTQSSPLLKDSVSSATKVPPSGPAVDPSYNTISNTDNSKISYDTVTSSVLYTSTSKLKANVNTYAEEKPSQQNTANIALQPFTHIIEEPPVSKTGPGNEASPRPQPNHGVASLETPNLTPTVRGNHSAIDEINKMLLNSTLDIPTVEAALRKAVRILGTLPADMEALAAQLGIVIETAVSPTAPPVYSETIPTAEQLGVTPIVPGGVPAKQSIATLKGATRGVVVYPPTVPSNSLTKAVSEVPSPGPYTNFTDIKVVVLSRTDTESTKSIQKTLGNDTGSPIEQSTVNVNMPTLPPVVDTHQKGPQPEIYQTLRTIKEHSPDSIVKVISHKPVIKQAPELQQTLKFKSLVDLGNSDNMPTLKAILTDMSKPRQTPSAPNTDNTQHRDSPSMKNANNQFTNGPSIHGYDVQGNQLPISTSKVASVNFIPADESQIGGLSVRISNNPAVTPNSPIEPKSLKSFPERDYADGNSNVSPSGSVSYSAVKEPLSTGLSPVEPILSKIEPVPNTTSKEMKEMAIKPIVHQVANFEGQPVKVERVGKFDPTRTKPADNQLVMDYKPDSLGYSVESPGNKQIDPTGALAILQEIKAFNKPNASLSSKSVELAKKLSDPSYVKALKALITNMSPSSPTITNTTPQPLPAITTVSDVTTYSDYFYYNDITTTSRPVTSTEEVEIEDIITTPQVTTTTKRPIRKRPRRLWRRPVKRNNKRPVG